MDEAPVLTSHTNSSHEYRCAVCASAAVAVLCWTTCVSSWAIRDWSVALAPLSKTGSLQILRRRCCLNTFRSLMLEEISKVAADVAKRKGATLLFDKAGPTAIGISNVSGTNSWHR